MKKSFAMSKYDEKVFASSKTTSRTTMMCEAGGGRTWPWPGCRSPRIIRGVLAGGVSLSPSQLLTVLARVIRYSIFSSNFTFANAFSNASARAKFTCSFVTRRRELATRIAAVRTTLVTSTLGTVGHFSNVNGQFVNPRKNGDA